MDDLIARGRELAEAARKNAEETGRASSSAQTVVMNVRMVAGMIAELGSGMEGIVAHADESRSQTGRVGTETEKTGECLKILLKSLEGIASSAKLIRDVARQTNLLALNAAIEAARAGQHGQGFAVVANEVKALAKKTDDTTGVIDAQLNEIQNSAARLESSLVQVNSSLKVIRETTDEVTAAVHQQRDSFAAMTAYATESATSVEAIASTLDGAAAMEQSMVTEIAGLCDLLIKPEPIGAR